MHHSSRYAQLPYNDPRISLPGFLQYRGLSCLNSDLKEPPAARIAREMNQREENLKIKKSTMVERKVFVKSYSSRTENNSLLFSYLSFLLRTEFQHRASSPSTDKAKTDQSLCAPRGSMSQTVGN